MPPPLSLSLSLSLSLLTLPHPFPATTPESNSRRDPYALERKSPAFAFCRLSAPGARLLSALDAAMALSKSTRIITLLVIDTLFFLLELAVGALRSILVFAGRSGVLC